MEEDGRKGWDTPGDRSTGRRDGMGGQQRSSRRSGGTLKMEVHRKRDGIWWVMEHGKEERC